MFELTQKRLKEVLYYNPETGLFIWLVQLSRRVNIGEVAGVQNSKGYIFIGVDGRMYRAHRLAFLYMTGKIPEQVDHDNHIRNDNRWKNLNNATNATNQKNQSMRSSNTSGCTGVSWHKRDKKWQAQIRVNKKILHLGSFVDIKDAVVVRKAADIKYNYHPNHGA